MRISTNELLIVLLVVLIIFGPKQLPKLGKMFGKTMRNFKEGMSEEMNEDDETAKDKAAAETKTEDKE